MQLDWSGGTCGWSAALPGRECFAAHDRGTRVASYTAPEEAFLQGLIRVTAAFFIMGRGAIRRVRDCFFKQPSCGWILCRTTLAASAWLPLETKSAHDLRSYNTDMSTVSPVEIRLISN